MQIISLNILGGRMFEPLKKFLTQEASSTDFFCFQEVYDSASDQLLDNGAKSNILFELRAMLPDFNNYYEKSTYDFGFPGVSAGLAVFVKKRIEVSSQGQIWIARHEGEAPTNLQYIRFKSGNNQYTLSHVHGVVWPGAKTDSPDRIIQSLNIDRFLEKENGKKILCGDFNLMPDTESVKMIEEIGMRDLIKDFHIAATRSKINIENYPVTDRQYFADYMFVSKDVTVEKFEVPEMEVSDHLPLKLQFE